MIINDTSTAHEQEILTAEQFASRLQIGRSTLFNWISSGILKQGQDYFKVGRVLRFIWDRNILLRISNPTPIKRSPTCRLKPMIDWEY